MSGNTFGKILRLTTFGESHGTGIGGIIDGCPAGLPISERDLQADLDLRKPGGGGASTSRLEPDRIRILSGVFEGHATGTPIGFYIENKDNRSRDYGDLARVFRPGHADWTYFHKYRGIRDYRGGGRASGRETACRVAGGAVARKILAEVCGCHIFAAAIELGGISVPAEEVDMKGALKRRYFAASDSIISAWDEAVSSARAMGDTLGGVVLVIAENVPPGLGEPVFDKLDAVLAHAMMSVGAVKGVEIGSGFQGSRLKGSENNDEILPASASGRPVSSARGLEADFASNNAGGILGGISTGQPILLRAAVKPIASIASTQNTIDVNGAPAQIRVGGRHDLSAIPRVVPVLSAMTALVLADALLIQSRMDVLP